MLLVLTKGKVLPLLGAGSTRVEVLDLELRVQLNLRLKHLLELGRSLVFVDSRCRTVLVVKSLSGSAWLWTLTLCMAIAKPNIGE